MSTNSNTISNTAFTDAMKELDDHWNKNRPQHCAKMPPKIEPAPKPVAVEEPPVCADDEHEDDGHWDFTYGDACYRCKKCWTLVFDG